MKAEYVDHMGTDLSVVNAARVSFDKVSDFESWATRETADPDHPLYREWDGYTVENALEHLSFADYKLIAFLAKHKHELPFAHTAITLRMKAPVPIRTQCFKHKVGFVENEESRRYIKSTPELYVPESFRNAPTGGAKQGSEGIHADSDGWMFKYISQCDFMVRLYESMVADGVCPEQARFVLPQGCMVNWIWTGSLLAFSRFYNMRTDSHAQKEIQDLARSVGEIIEPLFPVSWKALTQYNSENN